MTEEEMRRVSLLPEMDEPGDANQRRRKRSVARENSLTACAKRPIRRALP